MTPEAVVLHEWQRYAPWTRLTVTDESLTLPVDARKEHWSIVGWRDSPASRVDTGDVLVAAKLGSKLRAKMARDGKSFADRQVLHLVREGVFVHIERPAHPSDGTARPQRATDVLPPSGVVAVQTLLAGQSQDDSWTVRRLADAAGLSVGQSHRILSILEDADLLVLSEGSSARRVRDRGRLLDWLTQQPVARRSPLQWATYQYGRNTHEVVTRATRGLRAVGCVHAVTGMAAASLVDLGPTNVPMVHFWIDREADLASVAIAAGMKRSTGGANVTLWSDSDRSGTDGSYLVNDIPMSRDSRVYLDLLGLPRGSDVADTFRRVRLGF